MKYILGIVVAIVAIAVWQVWGEGSTGVPAKSDFEWHNASLNDIMVEQPVAGASVSRSFALTGSARGSWYFEASFPIEVVDENGNQIFKSYVQAQGEWMTEEFVPFAASITIPGDYRGPARLILHSDNASGLPEHDKSVSIPIVME